MNSSVKETLKKLLVPGSDITVYRKGYDKNDCREGEKRYAKIEYDACGVGMMMLVNYNESTQTLRIDHCGDYEDEEVNLSKEAMKIFVTELADFADRTVR